MNSAYIISFLNQKFNGRQKITILELFDCFPDLTEEETDDLYRILYINKFEIVEDIIINDVEDEFRYDLFLYEENYSGFSNEALVKVYQEGDYNALSVLIDRNKKFVRLIANRQMYIHKPSLDADDLFQTGCIGLMQAADKYVYEYKNKFLTYAYYWIFQNINRYIFDEGNLIRLPVHLREKISKIDFAMNKFNISIIDDFSINLIATETKLKSEEIYNALKYKHRFLKLKSFDSPVKDESDSTLIDFVEDTRIKTPEECFYSRALRDEMTELISLLDFKERYVIIRRFGLVDNRPTTLEEVGKELKLTRERIRQIESKALKKLRKMKNSKILKESYLEV